MRLQPNQSTTYLKSTEISLKYPYNNYFSLMRLQPNQSTTYLKSTEISLKYLYPGLWISPAMIYRYIDICHDM